MHFGKTITRIIAVALLGAFCFYATGKEIPIEVIEEDDDAWFQVTSESINVWYYEDELTDVIYQAAVEYGRENGVSIIPHIASPDDYLENANRATLDLNNGPDVIFLPSEMLEKAYLSSLVSEVTDPLGFISEDNFPQSAMNAVSYMGKYIAYPFSFEVPVMLFNRTYINEWAKTEAEKTLEATRIDPDSAEADEDEIAKRINIAENIGWDENDLFAYYANLAFPNTLPEFLEFADGFEARDGMDKVFSWNVNDIFYNYWFVGGSITVGGNAGDDETVFNISNEKAASALTAYKDVNVFFSIEADKVDYDSLIDDFAKGKLLYTIATSDAIDTLTKLDEAGELGFEFGFHPLPDISDIIESKSLNETEVIGVSAYSEHRELSNNFISWFLQHYSDGLYEKTGKLSANINVDTEKDYIPVFKTAYEKSIGLPKMVELTNFWVVFESMYKDILEGREARFCLKETQNLLLEQIESFYLY